MNKKSSSFTYLLEYLAVILLYMLGSLVSVHLLALSYHTNDMANRKKLAMEYASEYIEGGTYKIDTYHLDDSFNVNDNGEYTVEVKEVNEGHTYMNISITYNNEELISIPFNGGSDE
ncbi:MAG: hypothetical protein Q4D13_07045 [Erysipelotrichaceae bacterium]|nr:hypothetical protein [Erysipelotrichaceae bacterium]